MASVAYSNVIYGLRDLKITELDGSPQEDMGAAMKMAFKPLLQGGRLEGDDAIKAIISFIIGGEVEFSAGEMSSAALAIITGITLTTASTSPTEVTTLQIDEGQNMPYFKVYGKSLDDLIGDVHVLLSKVKVESDFDVVQLENGNFRVSNIKATAIDDGTNGVVKIIQNETAATLPSS